MKASKGASVGLMEDREGVEGRPRRVSLCEGDEGSHAPRLDRLKIVRASKEKRGRMMIVKAKKVGHEGELALLAPRRQLTEHREGEEGLLPRDGLRSAHGDS